MTRAAWVAAALTFSLGCGGKIGEGSDGGDAVASDGDATGDLGVADDNGWTLCEAPSGVGICGGPNACGAQCTNCFPATEAGELRTCDDVDYSFDAGATIAADTYLCPDGALNACGFDQGAPDCWGGACVTEDLPKLYLANGRPDLARYADRSTYTGAPLPPPPTSCPAVAQGLTLCGGVCTTCSDTDVCTGRSPLHPYSLCVPAEPTSFPCARGQNGYCNSIRSGFMCMTYKVDDTAQSIADQNSLCVPSSLCQAAASSYPGGAICTPGN